MSNVAAGHHVGFVNDSTVNSQYVLLFDDV